MFQATGSATLIEGFDSASYGVPLDQAGLILRHRSIDMTAYYAKADVALLKQVAQPWPEVKR